MQELLNVKAAGTYSDHSVQYKELHLLTLCTPVFVVWIAWQKQICICSKWTWRLINYRTGVINPRPEGRVRPSEVFCAYRIYFFITCLIRHSVWWKILSWYKETRFVNVVSSGSNYRSAQLFGSMKTSSQELSDERLQEWTRIATTETEPQATKVWNINWLIFIKTAIEWYVKLFVIIS
jgi:hypothetical protein